MIELRHINKFYQKGFNIVTALKNISLTVSSGEIFGIIGKSGAGKSTLIRCVNLLERPSNGRVRVADQDLIALPPSQLRDARRGMGMIFQHFNLLTHATVYQNIALALILAGCSKMKIASDVMRLLELIELTDKKDNYPSQLSGGQKQRVAIGRALANTPKILLCDEATSALDPQTRTSILDLLLKINQQMGVTILLITHEMAVIKQICDRVAVLDHGEIVEENNTTDFFINPVTPIGKAFSQSTIHQELPIELQNQLLVHPAPHANLILRIFFKGNIVEEPLVSDLVMRFHLELNILQAHIEYIKKTAIGVMVLEVVGHLEKLNSAIAYLKEKGLIVESLGYVKRDVTRIN